MRFLWIYAANLEPPYCANIRPIIGVIRQLSWLKIAFKTNILYAFHSHLFDWWQNHKFDKCILRMYIWVKKNILLPIHSLTATVEDNKSHVPQLSLPRQRMNCHLPWALFGVSLPSGGSQPGLDATGSFGLWSPVKVPCLLVPATSYYYCRNASINFKASNSFLSYLQKHLVTQRHCWKCWAHQTLFIISRRCPIIHPGHCGIQMSLLVVSNNIR